jgi:hypothetical protein
MRNCKINAAVFLCTAFMFRIVFFNVLSDTPFNPLKTHASIKSSISPPKHSKLEFEGIDAHNRMEYSLAEGREEENLHGRNGVESIPLFLIKTLHSSIDDHTSRKLNKTFPAHQYYSRSCSHRYLTLQVFRT